MEGTVQKISDEESEKYFNSRPRGSQIAAMVSKQVQFSILFHQHLNHQTLLFYIYSCFLLYAVATIFLCIIDFFFQSTVIQAKDVLHQKYEELEAKFSDGQVILLSYFLVAFESIFC